MGAVPRHASDRRPNVLRQWLENSLGASIIYPGCSENVDFVEINETPWKQQHSTACDSRSRNGHWGALCPSDSLRRCKMTLM
mmetsp:Transcript_27148/g.63107  ORF Transcript_27148/g.63107 Transcript_27148/m.63107 type:complete len:82 (-) Transcript_27148:1002-1247(-)